MRAERYGSPRKFISKKKLAGTRKGARDAAFQGADPHLGLSPRRPRGKIDELTSILIESASGIEDPDAPKDVSPLESQRSWERQAEENLLARLEKGGLLAPPGPVEEVLNTVVEQSDRVGEAERRSALPRASDHALRDFCDGPHHRHQPRLDRCSAGRSEPGAGAGERAGAYRSGPRARRRNSPSTTRPC